MPAVPNDFDRLMHEHRTLMSEYGRAQIRSSELLRAQAREIARMEAQLVQLRAASLLRDTALAWAREDRAALEQAIPGLPKRVRLARRVDELLARVRQLMRERLHWQTTARSPDQGVETAAARCSDVGTAEPMDAPEFLEASLGAADLVICQTGCLSHGDYWRVQNHCKRTGKACLLVETPDSLRVVHIHRAPEGDRARIALLPGVPA